MKNRQGRAAGILLAAGRGKRAGFSTNKAYQPVGGAPMIGHSLRTLDRSAWVVRLVMVIQPEDRDPAEGALRSAGITTPWLVAPGGSSRHQSEERGLEVLSDEIENGRLDLVAIHDGARPHLTAELLERLFQTAHRHGGSTPTLAIEKPVYQNAKGDLKAVQGGGLHRAQTPQVFAARELWAAYRRARQAGFEGLDTAETVERFSELSIRAVPGDPDNLKLTFPEDFSAANRSAR